MDMDIRNTRWSPPHGGGVGEGLQTTLYRRI